MTSANSASSTRRVSGELGISQSSVVRPALPNCAKILQNFLLTLVYIHHSILISSYLTGEGLTTLFRSHVWSFLSSCWVSFGRPFYLRAVLSDVPRHWRFPPASGGHTPQALTLFGEVGFIARRLGRLEKGNADGVQGIFGTAWRVWAPALRQDPP